MKKLIIIITLIPIVNYAQWTQNHGDSDTQHGVSICTVEALAPPYPEIPEGYITVGDTEGEFLGDNSDIYMVRTDLNGIMLSSSTFSGVSDILMVDSKQTASKIIRTMDDGYMIAGTSRYGWGPERAYFVKLSALFWYTWSEEYSISTGSLKTTDVVQVSDGGYVFTGSMPGENGFPIVSLSKISEWGTPIWISMIGGEDGYEGIKIIELNDGSFIILSRGGSIDSYLSKCDSEGTELWTQPLDFKAESIIVLESGEYILSGQDSSTPFNDKLIVKKINPNGIGIVWESELYMSQDIDYWNSDLILSSTNDLIITGTGTQGGGLQSSIILSKFDVLGNHLWTSSYDEYVSQNGEELVESENGGYTIIGSAIVSQSPIDLTDNDSNLYLINTTSNGETIQFESDRVWTCDVSNCIEVFDDSGVYFTQVECEEECLSTSITASTTANKKLAKITNLLGQDIPIRKNTLMLYIYDDGTVEKKFVVE